MPERIKPKFDFGPCTLNRSSIETLTHVMTSNLPSAVFAAEEGIWEIYDERRSSLLEAIKPRKRLDAFRARAEETLSGRSRIVELVFTQSEASLTSTLTPEDQTWLEHLIIDLRKALLRPSLSQRLGIVASQAKGLGRGDGFAMVTTLHFAIEYVVARRRIRYTRIILDKPEPNAFIENIKANLVSNVIWLLLGIVATFVVQWIVRNYDFDPSIFGR